MLRISPGHCCLEIMLLVAITFGSQDSVPYNHRRRKYMKRENLPQKNHHHTYTEIEHNKRITIPIHISTSSIKMSSNILHLMDLPTGTKPNTVYAQFHDKEHYQNIVNIYTHADYKRQAWVVFSSDKATTSASAKYKERLLNGELKKYHAYIIPQNKIPFGINMRSSKVECHSNFITEKEEGVKTSTLLITGLSSTMWEAHLDQMSCRGIEGNTAYCEKERTGDSKVQFFDKNDAESLWEDTKDKSMHKTYHITVRYVADVVSEKEIREMQDDCPDDEYFVT